MNAPLMTFSQVPVVTGKRILLRAPSPKDLKEFTLLNRRSLRFHRGLVSPPTDAAGFSNYLERCRLADTASFFICRTEDNAIVGAINLSQIFRGGFQSAYLGYFIGEPFAARGYMSEALQLVLRYAFRNLGLHRLEANIQPGNVASVALVQRAGFRAKDTRDVISKSVVSGAIMKDGRSSSKISKPD
jgi:[ribosomal protein S5]-alanine N-acetyltransferase